MDNNQIHLRDYFNVIIRRRWIIICFSSVLLISVLIFSIQQTPVYESTSTILINRNSPRVLSIQEVAPMGSSENYNDRDYYETQYKLIKSNTILKNVAVAMGIEEGDRYTTKKLKEIIKVKPVKNSQLVEITAEVTSPVLAAKIANSVVDEYIKNNLDRNVNTTQFAAQWLTQRIEEQRNKLRESETALQKYREKNNLRILPLLSAEGANEEIKIEYARLQSLLSNYLQRYTNAHPIVIEIKAQIRSLQDKIQGMEDVNTSKKTLEYRVLEREVLSNKRIYEVLLTRVKEIDLSSTLTVNNVSVIDRAEVPQKPVRPIIMLNLVIAIIAGLFGGTLLGFFIEYMDTTVKSPEDIIDILESHFLEAIPDIGSRQDDAKKDRIMSEEPNSQISESYRSLRTNVLNSISGERQMRTILITSAEPEAGKTMTAANLSIALSQEGHRVILIDCDLRKPRQHKIFGLDRLQGLSEYLTEDAAIEKIVQVTNINNLKIITSGKAPLNPGEIVGSKKMDELIALLRKKFEYIILDSPPISSVTDSIILANKADASILVVRSGKSHIPVIVRAKEQLSSSKAIIIGIVLNGLKIHHSNYYHYKYDGYYSNESESPKIKRIK